jgi:hypothetical protein
LPPGHVLASVIDLYPVCRVAAAAQHAARPRSRITSGFRRGATPRLQPAGMPLSFGPAAD